MSATPKILNIGLNIITNNISVTVSDNSLNLNTTTLSNGYYICIYDSTESNVFSNFILNIIIKIIEGNFDLNPFKFNLKRQNGQ